MEYLKQHWKAGAIVAVSSAAVALLSVYAYGVFSGRDQFGRKGGEYRQNQHWQRGDDARGERGWQKDGYGSRGMQGNRGDGAGNRADNIEQNGSGRGRGMNRQNCVAEGCLSVDGLEYPAGELSDAAKQALQKAIDDEYKAYATYEKTIADLGTKRPFSMIIRAEEQHISALKSLFDKYGLAIPENQWTGKVSTASSLGDACRVGVDAEIANAKLYREELLPAVKDSSDITAVFTNLMNASQQKHLPAFERCAA